MLVFLYMAVGFFWTLWNMRSDVFQRVAIVADQDGRAWQILAAMILGVLLWPAGMFVHVLNKR